MSGKFIKPSTEAPYELSQRQPVNKLTGPRETQSEAVEAVKPNLRIERFRLGSKVIIINRNYRFNVGYRASIEKEPGKWGDSTYSPEEAVGKLILEWLAKEIKTNGRSRI